MTEQIVWIDIPVNDLDRAIKFYSAVLGKPVKKETMPDFSMGILPHDEGEVSGCLFESKEVRPSDQGILVYFSVEGRLEKAVSVVAPNGGKVIKDKHAIGPYGFRAVIRDSEGNRVALHSMK